MIIVNTHKAKTNLSMLLALIEEKGEIVHICRNGKPIAELRPVASAHDPLKMDPQLQKVVYNESPSSPLSENDWPGDRR